MKALAAAGAFLMLAASAALAQTAQDRDTIIGSCLSELTLPQGACECIADRAETDLDPNVHAFLALTLSEPTAAAAQAAAFQVTSTQIQTMAMFMVTAPSICAQAAGQ